MPNVNVSYIIPTYTLLYLPLRLKIIINKQNGVANLHWKVQSPNLVWDVRDLAAPCGLWSYTKNKSYQTTSQAKLKNKDLAGHGRPIDTSCLFLFFIISNKHIFFIRIPLALYFKRASFRPQSMGLIIFHQLCRLCSRSKLGDMQNRRVKWAPPPTRQLPPKISCDHTIHVTRRQQTNLF